MTNKTNFGERLGETLALVNARLTTANGTGKGLRWGTYAAAAAVAIPGLFGDIQAWVSTSVEVTGLRDIKLDTSGLEDIDLDTSGLEDIDLDTSGLEDIDLVVDNEAGIKLKTPVELTAQLVPPFPIHDHDCTQCRPEKGDHQEEPVVVNFIQHPGDSWLRIEAESDDEIWGLPDSGEFTIEVGDFDLDADWDPRTDPPPRLTLQLNANGYVNSGKHEFTLPACLENCGVQLDQPPCHFRDRPGVAQCKLETSYGSDSEKQCLEIEIRHGRVHVAPGGNKLPLDIRWEQYTCS